MKRIRQSQIALQICRRIAVTLLAFAAILPPLAASAEKANVFFIHGANVSEQNARAWAAEMFKRLWQAGANMEFHPVAWESDIGPSYNYQVNVSNAFVTASRLAPYVNSIPGRRVVIVLLPVPTYSAVTSWRQRTTLYSVPRPQRVQTVTKYLPRRIGSSKTNSVLMCVEFSTRARAI